MRNFPSIRNISRYLPFVTLALTALLLLCFSLQTRLGATDGSARLSALFSISSDAARNGHILRLMTANLFHVNSGHLQSNIFGLVFFSSVLEIVTGKTRAIIVILLSAIGGTLGSLFFHIVDWMVGASTILFGVFGGLGVVLLKYRNELKGQFLPFFIAWWITLIPMCTLGYLSLRYVDQGAHIGGFLAGILATWVMLRPYSTTRIHPTQGVKARVLMVVLLAVFVLSCIKEIVPLFPLLA